MLLDDGPGVLELRNAPVELKWVHCANPPAYLDVRVIKGLRIANQLVSLYQASKALDVHKAGRHVCRLIDPDFRKSSLAGKESPEALKHLLVGVVFVACLDAWLRPAQLLRRA